MSTTPFLGLPLIAAAQAQKHVTHNEALLLLDALHFLDVVDRHLAAPPPSPPQNARYIVATGASGAWAGQTGHLAAAIDGVWHFVMPRAGWIARIADEAVVLVYDGAAWVPIHSGARDIQNLERLGIGTTADATNPLAAKLNALLLAARAASEGGNGDLRASLSKETPGDVVSLLFQTNYASRAELGLVGSDDLTLRVTADGTTWQEALRIPHATGRFEVTGNSLRIVGQRTPASASAPGDAGEICWDTTHIYVCVAANTWRRAAIASW